MKNSKVRISNGCILSALIVFPFLAMMFAKLFAGFGISWWIVTLSIWIIPVLLLCIIGLCLAAFVVKKVFAVLLNLFWLIHEEDDDDYVD